MILALFGFLQMSFTDILDILLLAFLIFFLFKWIRGTSAMSIFIAIVSLYFIRILVSAFNMKFMTTLLDTVLDVGMIALIVIFQPEIRKFLIGIGNRYMNSARGREIFNRIFGKKKEGLNSSAAVNELTEACRRMAESKTGAQLIYSLCQEGPIFLRKPHDFTQLDTGSHANFSGKYLAISIFSTGSE